MVAYTKLPLDGLWAFYHCPGREELGVQAICVCPRSCTHRKNENGVHTLNKTKSSVHILNGIKKACTCWNLIGCRVRQSKEEKKLDITLELDFGVRCIPLLFRQQEYKMHCDWLSVIEILNMLLNRLEGNKCKLLGSNGLEMKGHESIYSKEVVNLLRKHMKLHLSMTCQIANFGAKYDHMLCVPKITNW